MEITRNYEIIEHLLHPLTGVVLIENAIWQCYETRTLVGAVATREPDTASPVILQTTHHTLTNRGFGQSFPIDIHTWTDAKHGIGTFIITPILPITARLALDETGYLCLTKSFEAPTLHVTASLPEGYTWLYTIFHQANTFTPRLTIAKIETIHNHQYITSHYPAHLPNCSNDGTTCIGETRNTIENKHNDFFQLPLPLVTEILFNEFNNDLFPLNPNTHRWLFPSGKDTTPQHVLSQTFTGRTVSFPWPTIIL